MKRSVLYLMMVLVLILADIADASAQLYRRENRRGNRAFAARAYDEALERYKIADWDGYKIDRAEVYNTKNNKMVYAVKTA